MFTKSKVFHYTTQQEIGIDNPYLFQQVVREIDSWLSNNPSIKVVDVCCLIDLRTYTKKDQKTSITLFYKDLSPYQVFEKKAFSLQPTNSARNLKNKVDKSNEDIKQNIAKSQQLIEQSKQTHKQLELVIEQARIVREESRRLLSDL